MKKEKIIASSEKDIILGLIVSDDFCREIVPILEPRLLEIDYNRILAAWIKDYYNKFQHAPGGEILKVYRAKCCEITDEVMQDNILSVIKHLDDYGEGKFNFQFAVSEAIRHLKVCSLKNLSADIDAFVSAGELDKAEGLLTKYHKVEKATGESVSILDDFDTVALALTEEKEKLFSLPGAFGRLIGDVNREDFIAFLAPMKAGKTFQLVDIGIESLKRGLKVVMFSLEMSRTAMIKRVWRTLSGQVSEDIAYSLPYFEEDYGKFIVKQKQVRKKASTTMDVEKKQKSLKRIFRGGGFKIFAEPAYSLTVENLEVKLDDLSHSGFVPDVVIIDYADIMMPSEKGEYRNQIDNIWKKLRAIAQARKCVVFTASQTNRSGLNSAIEMDSIAEDIRKIAHVTSMVSISRPAYCKEHNIAVYSQLAIRDGESITRKVIATQCLALGRPVLDSRWEDEVRLEDGKDNGENERKIYKRKKD